MPSPKIVRTKNNCAPSYGMQSHKHASAAYRLKSRRQIDIAIFDLVAALEAARQLELPDDFDQVGLPTITTLIRAAAKALEPRPQESLLALSELMESINGYSGFFEHEEQFDAAARLKECWDQINELLLSTSPDMKLEPWVDIPAAVRAQQTEDAA